MPESNTSQVRPAPLNRQNHLGKRAPNASPAASLNALAVQRARAANVLGDEYKNVAFEARSNGYGQAVVRTDDEMARRIQKFARSVRNKSVLPEQQQNIRRVAGRKKLSSRTQRL